jgi:hypothetical protein
MTIRVELNPEMEARLVAEARSQGMPLEKLAERLLKEADLSGDTGQKIVRAILAGERDPRKLAELSDPRIHASKEEIAKSLEGNWRQDSSSCCAKSSRCMTPTSNGSPSATNNYRNF